MLFYITAKTLFFSPFLTCRWSLANLDMVVPQYSNSWCMKLCHLLLNTKCYCSIILKLYTIYLYRWYIQDHCQIYCSDMMHIMVIHTSVNHSCNHNTTFHWRAHLRLTQYSIFSSWSWHRLLSMHDSLAKKHR